MEYYATQEAVYNSLHVLNVCNHYFSTLRHSAMYMYDHSTPLSFQILIY